MRHSRVQVCAAVIGAVALGAAVTASSRADHRGEIAAARDAAATDPLALSKLAALLDRAGLFAEAAEARLRAVEADPALGRQAPALADQGTRVSTGPDVVLSNINGTGNYTSGGSVNGVLGFSLGTTACNWGDAPVDWRSTDNRHPVISQHMYRLWAPTGAQGAAGGWRIEQVGVSWVKHGSCASQLTLCGPCGQSPFTCSDTLSPNCADPYFASLNGLQSTLGPRTAINPSTGGFVFPYPDPPAAATAVDRRLQVLADDMDPALYPGARYIIEGQYVAADDARAGNGLNNVTTRTLLYNWNASLRVVSFLTPNGDDQIGVPAIRAWAATDPTVTVVEIDTAGEGLFPDGAPAGGRLLVACGVADLGNGMWRYEYAVQNLTSDRGVRSFAVPMPAGATVSNVGFHGSRLHSGDGIGSTAAAPVTADSTPWSATRSGGALTWSTSAFAETQNANALRWGMLFNFRFDADAPPSAGAAALPVRLGLFKPSTPAGFADEVRAGVRAPICLLAGDVNGDGAVNFLDLNLVLSGYGAGFGMEDLARVLSSYGVGCS